MLSIIRYLKDNYQYSLLTDQCCVSLCLSDLNIFMFCNIGELIELKIHTAKETLTFALFRLVSSSELLVHLVKKTLFIQMLHFEFVETLDRIFKS